jgi:hypothetical protein
VQFIIGLIMSKWHGGKGSKQRPTDHKKFEDNWDRIFGNKKKEKQSASDYKYTKEEKT